MALKPIAMIEVLLDEAVPTDAGGCTDQPFGDEKPYFRVRMGPGSSNTPTVLAHELGHVIARVYNLPANEKDRRNWHRDALLGDPMDRANHSKATMRDKLESELEAWGLARQMGLDLDTVEERKDIASYVKGLNEADRE